MATPSGKNNPGATPTQVTSSPYPLPASAAMARGLSHKSPGMIRTPSVSGYTGHAGAAHHQTHPSVSSTHQFPTPLATATGLTEDTGVPFSSPSALLALGLGGTPAANEVLNENDIQGLGIPSLGMSGPAPKDNEEERMKNLAEVMRLLRTRVAGRGICREGLERLGRLEGLECMWQDDNLSIAGNFVDLEIEFWHGREYVKDVVLRYATPDAAEGEVRKEATEVLKRVLLQPPEQQENGEWKDPVAFHKNLKYLARMDSLSQLVNCFQALEELNESLQRIHDQEQKENPRDHWEYVCTGEVGRPFMHLRETLGLSLQYWAEQRRVLDSEPSKNEDKMDVDGSEPEEDEVGKKAKYWKMAIECEEGYPSLRISKEWVDSPVFKTDGEGKSINWADPPPTLVSPMNDSGVMSDSEAPNRRFVARLDPPVPLPMHAALEVYRLLEMDMPQEQKLTTYENHVLPPNAGLKQQPYPLDAASKVLPATNRQRKRELYCFDGTKPIKTYHKYSMHTFERVAGRTIKDLPFSHPRQLAAIIPVSLHCVYIDLRADLSLFRSFDNTHSSPAPSDESFPGAKQWSRKSPRRRSPTLWLSLGATRIL